MWAYNQHVVRKPSLFIYRLVCHYIPQPSIQPAVLLHTLLEKLTDEAIASLYATKSLPISLYLTKLYVTIARASSVKYCKIRKNFSNSAHPHPPDTSYSATQLSRVMNITDDKTNIWQIPAGHKINILVFGEVNIQMLITNGLAHIHNSLKGAFYLFHE